MIFLIVQVLVLWKLLVKLDSKQGSTVAFDGGCIISQQMESSFANIILNALMVPVVS